jgi:hypothetical protein
MPFTQPSDQGISMTSTSYASGRVAIIHTMKVVKMPTMAMGVLLPGFSLRHER